MKKTPVILFLVLALASCNNEYQRVLKSTDQEFKAKKAVEYYEKEQYFKAIPLFEELMSLGKGSLDMEDIYYYYCQSHFEQGNYIVAAYHFKEYFQRYPYNSKAKDALYMHAECYLEQSPTYKLEQTQTYKAIEAYQTFINAYPDAPRVAECNEKIDAMRAKLERKALYNANLYYRTKNYRAAAISYRNLLIDYPDIDNAQEIQYKIIFAFRRYADLSIPSKQAERYGDVIAAADDYISRYPNSENKSLVIDQIEASHFRMIESSLDYALVSSPDKRIELLEDARDQFQVHKVNLKQASYVKEAAALFERSFYEEVKAWHTLAREKTDRNEKIKAYKNVSEAYFTYTNRFASGRYADDAKKLYDSSIKILSKLQ